MFRRLLRCIILGLLLGTISIVGVYKYQSDQNNIHHRISEIQRQQEMLLISTKNPLPALVERVSPSVVYVKVPLMWSGSGIIVGPSTVLTAKHIVHDVNEIYVEAINGKKYEAINWVEDEDNDCALLFFDPREKFENVVKFADSDKLQIGDVVFTMGSPFGKDLFNTVTFGIISGLNRDIRYFGIDGLITSDAAGNPGNSGGPVFDMQGKIVGIVVGTLQGAEGLAIIIPANICRRLYENSAKEKGLKARVVAKVHLKKKVYK